MLERTSVKSWAKKDSSYYIPVKMRQGNDDKCSYYAKIINFSPRCLRTVNLNGFQTYSIVHCAHCALLVYHYFRPTPVLLSSHSAGAKVTLHLKLKLQLIIVKDVCKLCVIKYGMSISINFGVDGQCDSTERQ